MKFGKFHGWALAVLGAVLIAVQMVVLSMPKSRDDGPASGPVEVHKMIALPGALGTALILIGVVILISHKRTSD